jgi:2-C-methyl-D-erythritol 4-phosphate cytidylyltransferase/2-C-methyl-D-erythritol 2,4-cyclodiphosphate synthase
MFVTAIIAAAGRGRRVGAAVPKQLLTVGGRPVLERSVDAFAGHPAIDEIIVVLPEHLAGRPPAYLHGLAKPVRVIPGGPRRQDSVANGFHAASDESELIVIHDAARPFASRDLIHRTIAAARESGAAVAALPVHETVKRATGGAAAGPLFVEQTLARDTLFLAQTPQAFRRDVLRDALVLGIDATDEASMVEGAGHQVRIVDGEATNIKITTADDLLIAEAIAGGGRPARTGRAGTGYDLHPLAAGRPLVVGGVTIPCERGAAGHSDADVVCHAVIDAVLGAAALGDIGRHFPDTDPRWKGASSLDLASRAASLVADQGYEIGNVDVTVLLETPKIGDHVDAMRRALAAALGIDASRVSIKGKTNEGVDAIGRGEAIAAHAIALIRAR